MKQFAGVVAAITIITLTLMIVIAGKQQLFMIKAIYTIYKCYQKRARANLIH